MLQNMQCKQIDDMKYLQVVSVTYRDTFFDRENLGTAGKRLINENWE